jgi:SpoVK/Ycf46/Vps4 family AAA+-type ATPase
LFSSSAKKIDGFLALAVRPAAVSSYRVAVKELPAYRFVDLYQAIEALVYERDGSKTLDCYSGEDLNALLHGKAAQWVSRAITQASRTAWPVAYERERFLPIDQFWVLAPAPGEAPDRLLLRLRYIAYSERAVLEAAATSTDACEGLLNELLARSDRESIYRKQVLELAFQGGTKDEYGDVERQPRLRILFKRIEPVGDSDLVIDEDVRRVLHRNVIDLQVRRDILKAHGVPVRRGILLFGPPGTGKTFACRYLCTRLPETTRIMVTGSALLEVTQIFHLARLLQPSVVFLEDVDLVFMAREINLYSSVLGELLDQMDGLRPYEDIGFVLTTNAIDRMEAAVKDRPGRISQCVYFGPPGEELRGRYLAHYLRAYKTQGVDIERLVAGSKGATQAFLKEWVHRAVQVATERLQAPTDALELTTSDFLVALDEMKRFAEGSTARVIGFHV